MWREKQKEDNFRKILESFKSPGFKKLTFECSMMQYGGKFEIRALNHASRIRASVTLTSISSYLYSKELIKLRVLDFRRFFRNKSRSYLLWTLNPINIVRDVKVSFLQILEVLKDNIWWHCTSMSSSQTKDLDDSIPTQRWRNI